MLVKTAYEHIYIDENGVPQIADANTKVIELVLDHIAYGWSPEELVHQHPHLTLGQVHSALAYYWDHQSELDLDIQQRLHNADEMRSTGGETCLERRLLNPG